MELDSLTHILNHVYVPFQLGSLWKLVRMVFILSISRIQCDIFRDKPILQSDPRRHFVFDGTLLQKNLSSTSGQATVPAVPGVAAIAHVEARAARRGTRTLPLEAP